MQKRAVSLTAILTALPYFCTPIIAGQALAKEVKKSGALVKVVSTGGRCTYGGCYGEVSINAAGAYTWTEGTGDHWHVKGEGQLPHKDIAQLIAQIKKTNFLSIKSVGFKGTCPSAYDGQALTFTFQTDKGQEVIPECQYAVDDRQPLFSQIKRLLRDIYAKPK
ncbi:MAG TPA: hypothetical protein DCZ01_06605 [Elusimicrobia bacterium]|nr:MAG: hypothetical protein A2X37_11940 [Elusimicrobia bacterium GWA2_66_18]OGR70678.1 MAG: hypothetical protein A2X40_06100 [Elusimicrobia bacterium GWC2_65_9]HAZ08180.1 hypothetical protein [Elusimicrobiota bacterium]